MKKINFAILGVGHIGKRHGSMIKNNDHCNLIAFCDILPKEKVLTEEFKNIPLYVNLKEMVSNHPEIDVVCVCTPNGLHSEQSIELLNYKKHVVVEKTFRIKKI